MECSNGQARGGTNPVKVEQPLTVPHSSKEADMLPGGGGLIKLDVVWLLTSATLEPVHVQVRGA